MKKEEVLNFYTKYQIYINPVLVAVSSLILIIFVIYPQTTRLLSDGENEKRFANKYLTLDAKAAELQAVNSDQIKEKVELVLVVYPTDRDYSNTIALIQRTMAEYAFNLESVALSSGGSEIGVSSYAVKIDFQGPKQLLNDLLDALENAPRVMKVTSIDISSSQDAGVVGGNITVDVLFQNLPTSLGKVDDPLPSLSEKEETILSQLQKTATSFVQTATSIGQRGKSNPFE